MTAGHKAWPAGRLGVGERYRKGRVSAYSVAQGREGGRGKGEGRALEGYCRKGALEGRKETLEGKGGNRIKREEREEMKPERNWNV